MQPVCLNVLVAMLHFYVFQRAGGYLLGEGSKKSPNFRKAIKAPFFKRSILDGLASLGDRFRTLKKKEADLLVQNKALYGDKEHLSQQEYIQGISAWNFNLEDLKTQATLDGFNDLHDSELASFPIKPLKALKGCFDVCEDDVIVSSPRAAVKENERNEGESSG
ncbi:hypothetical protein CJ030_MR2G019448 [Morella rubra]|uniref:Uncharacterized protein n=1 Tax=Morella rubra TaxID=262757 RepID=A0A6A1WCD3_9ROSI|nr:hypothetical protein CJ030_MR2G019448 [Morella rubra]